MVRVHLSPPKGSIEPKSLSVDKYTKINNCIAIVKVYYGKQAIDRILQLKLINGVYKSGLYIKSNIVGIGTLITLSHVAYMIYAYPNSSIIYFVSKELWF